jgi:hypothetical protein
MYRRLGSKALRLKVTSPGWYPDLGGPPYTASFNAATPAPNTATEPSHHSNAAVGSGLQRGEPGQPCPGTSPGGSLGGQHRPQQSAGARSDRSQGQDLCGRQG